MCGRGDVLAVTSGGQTMSVIVRRVDITDGMARPEVLVYRMAFANDWAEGWGSTLSEAIAAETLLPETALSSTTPLGSDVLANLQQLQVASATGAALQVDGGVISAAGGGFEVRRRDGAFGPRWTRTSCCAARYEASQFLARGRWSTTTCECMTDRRRHFIRDFRARCLRTCR